MNLRQLLFVQSVAETRSFSKAAEMCHATQPTLSNAISQLEEELDGKLFVRTTRKVALTPFGEHLLPYINGVLAHKAELEAAAQAYHNPAHKLLRIGLSPLIDMQLLNEVLEPYRQAHPDVSIFFKECLLDDLEQRMQKEQIDFAVVPVDTYAPEESRCFFYEEPLYYLPQETDAGQHKRFQYEVDALPDAPIILTGGGCGLNGSLETVFRNERAALNSYPGQALSYKIIEEWAALGIGAGILPRAKISADNKMACPLMRNNGRPATFAYEWIWRSARSGSANLDGFIEYLQTTVPALVKGENRFATA